jgi:Amt family ammonium transporter
VAITPAAGFISIPHSLIVGIVSAIVSNMLVEWRTKRTNIDDTLDVFPCHGVGGMSGMILTGVFAHPHINGVVTTKGLIFGEFGLFGAHVIALVAVSAFAFGGSWILLKVTDMISPLRVSAEEENEGLDWSQHGEKL